MHLPTACRSYSLEERKEKSCYLCACYLVTGVITGKIVEDEAIYDPQRFLVENFFLLVIKPPGTHFNNELLPSCKLFFPRYQRSSACSAGSNFLRWLNTVLAVCGRMSFAKSWQEEGCSSQPETWQVKNILMKDSD